MMMLLIKDYDNKDYDKIKNILTENTQWLAVTAQLFAI